MAYCGRRLRCASRSTARRRCRKHDTPGRRGTKLSLPGPVSVISAVWKCRLAGSVSIAGWGWEMPALFTRISTAPQ